MMYPAAISKFRLDAFLVTVGRFRSFVNAWDGGWRPAAGSGKHTHLNNGAGLVLQGSAPPTYEGGWDPSNAQFLTTTAADWNSILTMNGYVHGSTWTMNPTSNDNLPITGLDWWEAYAFCIWDGGFLPSDSEILYTAAGGGDSLGQRIYPWSSPPSNATVDCTYANYGGPDPACTNPAAVRPVGALPNGNGRWGHSDLAGNAWQWTLDSNNGFGGQCTDCYYPCFGGGGANCGAHYVRGGAFTSTSTADMQPARGQAVAGTEARSANSGATQDLGVRCARIP
jgi:formylglycine-generating enzyme required for sulfatase activity